MPNITIAFGPPPYGGNSAPARPRNAPTDWQLPGECRLAARVSASLVDLQVAQRRAQDRRVDAEPIGAADKVTEDVVGLGRASGLDIVQHRRSAGRTLLGKETAVEVYQRSRRRVAFGGRNPGTFVECRGDEGRPLRVRQQPRRRGPESARRPP